MRDIERPSGDYAVIVPLEPSSPSDPRVHLSDEQRPHRSATLPNGTVVVEYFDPPLGVSDVPLPSLLAEDDWQPADEAPELEAAPEAPPAPEDPRARWHRFGDKGRA